tara:strand:- start:1390 stop:2358 length:969 start_codon:yes stop_codon:yes gene_type:complete
MLLKLEFKYFSFRLNSTLNTSKGIISQKKGWLVYAEDIVGNIGWGEIAPIDQNELKYCEDFIQNKKGNTHIEIIESEIDLLPPSVAFGIGSALSELKGEIGVGSKNNWLKPYDSAILLSSRDEILIEINKWNQKKRKYNHKLTFKIKVAIESIKEERNLLMKIFKEMPENAKLRIDANGGWSRIEANAMADYLRNEPKLEWIEQPLPPNDIEGLLKLKNKIPVALDESLLDLPSLRSTWPSWQIRRPLIEGDPRSIMKDMNKNSSFIVISTAFETGIGSRWVKHLAALQQKSPTPTAPGLAPGWCPNSELFSTDPFLVWEAA